MKSRRLLIEVSIATFIIFILLWLMVPKFYRANHINLPKYFPDPQLRESAALTLGFFKNEFFTRTEAKGFTGDLCVDQCTNLKGLEFFENLTKIVIESDTIEDFDLTMLPKLESVIITAPNLVSVNTGNNPHLKHLSLTVIGAKRTINTPCKFDLTKNTKLQTLFLRSTDVKELDVSQCPDLYKLEVVNQLSATMVGLKSVDLSANRKLKTLRLIKNQLHQIDISMLHELEVFECMRNRITTLDVSQNPKLNRMMVQGNPLEHIHFPPKTNYQTLLLDFFKLDDETVSVIKKQNISYKRMDFPR